MVRAAEKALGTFVKRFETDDARRGGIGVGALLVGLLAALVSVPILIAIFADGEAGQLVAALLLAVAIAGLWWGASCTRRYFMTPGEVFRVRELGLVYEHATQFRVIPWDQISHISHRGQNHWVGQMLGWDIYSVIKIKGGDGRKGGRLLVTGFTKDADLLVTLIQYGLEHGTVPPLRTN
ncbi:hypothetical protein [Spirillospora sp. NPDC047279]|uniref:hypothetical protein n=1 Tax=Spirillospora sp. NPDC047279 TaxID=3155478 RepID=UPI0033D16344